MRFAVVNLERGKAYPLNFVCMLPVRLNIKSRDISIFEQHFGAESLQVAKKLLTDALQTERDKEVKNEIKRRLKLLDPELTRQKICPSCGKPFRVDSKKSWKMDFCEECGKKKFGCRPALK